MSSEATLDGLSTSRACADRRAIVVSVRQGVRRCAGGVLLGAIAFSGYGCAAEAEHRNVARSELRPAPTPFPSGPLFEGGPPARTMLHARPLGVSADGAARWLVRVTFARADGATTTLLHGGDVEFTPSRGRAQWQTRLRFDGPAAIVSTTADGPLSVEVTPRVGVELPSLHATTDTRRWKGPRVSVKALGPHLVQVGWFPATTAGTVRIVRSAPRTGRMTFLAGPGATYRDATVSPATRYRYRVEVPGRAQAAFVIDVPAMPPHGHLADASGKAMWLSFSPWVRDVDAYSQIDPAAIVERASSAGVRALELRTAYGPYWEVTPASRPTIDALIDGAVGRGIAPIGWTVPRSVDYDDLACAVRTATYRTVRGNGFAALALDLERGDEYLGRGAAGYAALTDYLRLLRAALGPGYPLIATVEDPYLGHLTNAAYPYAAIAASADALQPMTYWRMLSKKAVTPQAVRQALRGSFATTLREARRNVAIDLGAQTSPEGPRGAPPPGEIAAGIQEARALGALGITFYDWRGTSDEQWRALAATPW